VVEQRPMQEGRNMTMMMAPSKAVLAGRIDVGEVSNGEVREAHHMGDVASAAIDSPAVGPVVAADEEDAGAEDDAGVDVEAAADGDAAAVLAELPPEDGEASSADTAVS
jgi:translation initiation factor IF-3